ncbi:membrane protein [Desulfuromonas sp. TF]|jgi:PBP1b-binding outer membrane lipoprotein LpoB|uniref:membrane protein n=1 Tax=Desulfuromonas sp. TF TaxID=1232410 RepID=UPI00041A3E69|nr:membrane protein [Desulfuromonas sp. TF]
MNKLAILLIAATVLIQTGCTYTTRVNNAAGRPTIYEDTTSTGAVAGIGMESQDITSMTDQMVRDMLSNPILAGRNPAPRVIVDAEYFHNEGSTRINKNMITDRMRIDLNRSANGRMVFIGRHFSDMVAKERELKREGMVTEGTIGSAKAQAGADFRLGGRITTQDAVRASSGMASRYHLITFEMIDLETGIIVWSGMYEFKKSAQDDVVYR